MIAPAKSIKCLVPGCNRPAGPARGVCAPCYRLACQTVQLGNATWEELERRKLVLPTTRCRNAAFREALSASRANDKSKRK